MKWKASANGSNELDLGAMVVSVYRERDGWRMSCLEIDYVGVRLAGPDQAAARCEAFEIVSKRIVEMSDAVKLAEKSA